ncbi:DUF4148 domain-containing protein [Caballeronia sp. LP006]|uniref:DUF4148 domain-containing protein n=1 Tax=Caballeronia sp. LP006 TaxID=3038552 RepID=UPI0028552D7F|nr:DUF4148 domain-containing protein [Caballeronia sp. LP006]MDR5832296.1 DUF4148 domain-containing protein [Caballeronia sp. LP006]
MNLAKPLLCLLLSFPLLAAAGTDNLSHARVVAELSQLEHVGYVPSESDPAYPANLQAAEAHVQIAVASKATPNGATALGGAPEIDGDSGTKK